MVHYRMRKLGEIPSGQSGIVDNFSYNGYFEDDTSFLSDISFYEYGDDASEDEVDKSHDAPILKKREDKCISRHVNNSKLAIKSAKTVKGRDKQVLKKIQKVRKSRIETSDEESASDNNLNSDKKVCEEPYTLVNRHHKPPKKLKDRSTNCDDFEGDLKVRSEFGSVFRDKKARETKIKEDYWVESLDSKEADAVNGGTTVQAFQRRKKLCKAAELNSAGEKGHKGKNKDSVVEVIRKKGEKVAKAKDYSSLGGMQKLRLEDFSSDSEATPRRSSKSGLGMEQTFAKEEDGLMRAEHSREGRSMKKSFSSVGHALSHRELEPEDLASALLMGKRQGSNQHLMPSVLRAKNKTGQETKDFCVSLETVHSVVDHRRHVEKVCDNGVGGEEVSSGVTEDAEGNKELVPGENVKGNADAAGTKVGWVMCDSCKKWRCVPASLTDMIESTNCGWYCKDNPDKKFADCSVPQEKTNTEINRELNLSEVSFCEEGDEKHPAIESPYVNGNEHQSQSQATWTLIKHNIFQHRQRKTETLDEQMVCECKPPEDGSIGCGDDCHNRMLNIECVSQTCPCGDTCSNQQFQRRLYKKVDWFRCGKKGFGLQVLEDVSKGSFIIEYVGEVLNMAAYEARQKQYAFVGQKHFYFMTLSGSEIIDACYKGNLGRFINHSCEPNCTTEKWMVNGEVCIGLFAIRDLKKGEEITFDYNFVRVCGAAAKKCLCGSHECRGFIGGDPLTPQSIVDSDTDEDDPEPIMLEESSEDESRIEDSKILTHKKRLAKAEAIIPLDLRNKERIHNEISERLGATSKQVKTKASIKTSTSANVKKLTIKTDGGHFEGETAEEELNNLVDENGGLSKGQPNVATSYLKLLLRTAASSGDTVNGEGSRSIRDLSLVLDALLKTQSRAILFEVLSKNGFQIMHKTMKQSRKDYKRTPILRKLLKVLDFLAARRILTVEQINSGPTRPGAESVKDSILQLCWSDDSEVRQMALHLQEKYMKGSSQKPLRRGQGPSSDLSKWRLFPKQNQQGKSGAVAAVEDEATRKRKRPNRWDQPSQEVLDTTLAGGLPKSFWPFNANNLLLGSSQQTSISNQCLRQTEGASTDELGAMHPVPPSFSVPDNQHHTKATHIEGGVVSGIPVEQFTAGSTMGYNSQQGPVCIGIPVSQFQGAAAPGLEFPYMSRMLTSTHEPPDGQALALSSNMEDVQDVRQQEFDVESADKAGEEPKISFGISHSQFFQQMHGMFGSIFHPWQLQILMAPHAWGPFLGGDARIRDLGFLNDSGPASRQLYEYRGSEETMNNSVEPSGAVGHVQEMEPHVPRLSPPLPPPPPPPPFANPSSPVQAPRHTVRPHMGNNHPGGSNVPYQQLKSSFWRPQRWNSPRWQKFPGNNKYRNPGYRRDNPMQRPNRQNFGRQGPPRPHNWEDSSSWKPPNRNWGQFNARGIGQEGPMEVDGDGGFNGPYGPPFQDSGNPSGTMPLERPWGYKEENHGGARSNYPVDFSQEVVNDTVDSWGVNS